jgi:hypothetical protein
LELTLDGGTSSARLVLAAADDIRAIRRRYLPSRPIFAPGPRGPIEAKADRGDGDSYLTDRRAAATILA